MATSKAFKLNRCDLCGNLSEDVDIRNGIRMCPECMGTYAEEDCEPSYMGDLDDLDSYGEDMRDEMLEEVAEIRKELGFDAMDVADLEADAEEQQSFDILDTEQAVLQEC